MSFISIKLNKIDHNIINTCNFIHNKLLVGKSVVNGYYRIIIMIKGWDDFSLANHAWLNLSTFPCAKTHPVYRARILALNIVQQYLMCMQYIIIDLTLYSHFNKAT